MEAAAVAEALEEMMTALDQMVARLDAVDLRNAAWSVADARDDLRTALTLLTPWMP